MASKFWGRGSESEDESEEEVTSEEESLSTSDEEDASSSEESSEEGSESESEDEEERKGGASRFLLGSSESESEDERRVVKSAKDKAIDDLLTICNDIRNKMHINDWQSIQTLWDKLNKQLEKTQKVTGALGTPRPYVKILVELEDFLNKTLAEKPKLSPTNARALARMKQTLRKHNGTYAEQMAAFRENPESPEPSDEESGQSDEDESDEDRSNVESDLDSEAEAERQFKTVRTGVQARPKDKILSMDPKEISYEMVHKKLREVAAARGRATALDRQDQVEMLSYLAGVARGPAQKTEVLVHLLTVIFDMNQPTVAPMTTPNWKRCASILFEILELADRHPNIMLVDQPPEEERTEEPGEGETVKVWGNPAAFLERLDDEWTGSLKSLDPHAHGYMDRLRDEPALLALATKVTAYLQQAAADRGDKLAAVALRRIDHIYYKTLPVYEATRKMAHALRDEAARSDNGPSTGNTEPQAEAQVEPEARPSSDREGGEQQQQQQQHALSDEVVTVRLPVDFELPEDAGTLLEELSKVVYANGNDNQKGQAILSNVYWKSIHDRFYEARDALLMSRIAEQTQQLDAKMQVLFNRTTAQLGLCAFRAGLISDAHACLGDLYSTGRVKELLAQGLQQRHYGDRTPEQEAAERRRQVPFHLHINLELLEASYLISAALLEVPLIAALGPVEARKRSISKPLRRLMDHYERQTFVGPPENVRDHVIAACKSLSTGDWKRAYEYASALPCWSLLSGAKETVLQMLKVKFQEEGLRTYLLANAQFYLSLSSQQLCELYDLPPRRVHAIVSKMIAEEALPASHDQPTGTIVIHHQELTRLQMLSSQFADKAAILVDLNERALAMRTGVLHTEDEDESGGGGGGRRGGDGSAPGGRRTRMGSRVASSFSGPSGGGGYGYASGGRGGRGGRGRGRGTSAGGFMADIGFTGGVYGRGRTVRQRDDSNYMSLGRVGGGYGRAP